MLELGAGAALPSIIASKCGARQVAVTDYPAPGILEAISKNVKANVVEDAQDNLHILGLDWTDAVRAQEKLNDLTGGQGFDM